MDNIKASPIPFWLDLKRRRITEAPTLSSPRENIAAFLVATSRLTVYDSGQFAKIKQIAKGTSFRTETLKNRETGTVVVRKFLRASPRTSQSGFDESIFREIKVSAYPDFRKHPNIVDTYGILIDGLTSEPHVSISLVIEYAEHGSLQDFLSQKVLTRTSCNYPEMKSLIIDVCAGLEMLHKCRVIHGDVKAENVLIFPSYRPNPVSVYTAKIADFGSSVVEDTTYYNADADREVLIYHGTPLYLPPYVKTHSGRIPFHCMPAVDIYSFGLLLWKMLNADMQSQKHPKRNLGPSSDRWEDLSIKELHEKFECDVNSYAGSLSNEEIRTLLSVFRLCITDRVIDSSPIAPVDRESLYRKSFSLVKTIREALEDKNGDDSILGQLNSFGKPFHYGSFPSKETLSGFSWNMQRQMFEGYLNTFKDREQSAFSRGEAAFQLSTFCASGTGHKKNMDKVIEYLSSAALLGDSTAQLLCPRIFDTHGEPMDRLLHPANSDQRGYLRSIGAASSSSDVVIEYQNEIAKSVYSGCLPSSTQSFSHPKGYSDDETMDTEMNDSSSLDSEASNDALVIYRASLRWDQQTERRGKLLTKNYFWRKVCQMQHDLGSRKGKIPLRYGEVWYLGLEDPRLLKSLQNSSFSQHVAPTVLLASQDEITMEIPLLHHIAYCGMLKLLKVLLQKGMSLESIDDEGQTILHISMANGYAEMTKYLIGCQASPCVRDNARLTPLHFLYMFHLSEAERDERDPRTDNDEREVIVGDPEVVYEIAKMLITAGADVNAAGSPNHVTVDAFFKYRISGTPLQAAITMGNKVAVQVLLRLGADPNLCPFLDSDKPLDIAAQLHLAVIAQTLLDYGASLVTDFDSKTGSASWAMHSVGIHIPPMTRWLLHGVNYKIAARETIEVLIQAALEQNLDVDLKNREDLTAFQVALQETGEDDYIVSEFLDSYATMPVDGLNSTIYSCEEDEQNASKVELVLSRGATISRDATLHKCATFNALQAAKVILKQEEGTGLIDVGDENGQTPLHRAVINGNENMAKFLLNEGADIDALDSDGLPAVAYAVSSGYQSIASLLLAENADFQIYSGDYEGGTILHIAESRNPANSKSMLTFLLSGDLVKDESDPARFPRLHEKNVIDATEKIRGNTALHFAAHYADFDGVASIVAVGADTQVKKERDETPLMSAKKRLLSIQPSSEPDRVLVKKLQQCISYLERVPRAK